MQLLQLSAGGAMHNASLLLVMMASSSATLWTPCASQNDASQDLDRATVRGYMQITHPHHPLHTNFNGESYVVGSYASDSAAAGRRPSALAVIFPPRTVIKQSAPEPIAEAGPAKSNRFSAAVR